MFPDQYPVYQPGRLRRPGAAQPPLRYLSSVPVHGRLPPFAACPAGTGAELRPARPGSPEADRPSLYGRLRRADHCPVPPQPGPARAGYPGCGTGLQHHGSPRCHPHSAQYRHEAASLCNDLLPKLNKTSAIEVIATVYLTYARCLFANGQTDKATHLLAKLEHILEPARNQRFLSHLLAERLRQAWLGGGRERAELLAQRARLAEKLQAGEWDKPQAYTEQRERQGLATVYWLRATGRPAIAARILRVLARELRETGLVRSEEHTSELQSRPHLVCRLLLE